MKKRWPGNYVNPDGNLETILWKWLGWLMVAAPLSMSAAGSNWMSSLSDHVLISSLSIPGTHDSCARYEPAPGTLKCQNLSIGAQLNAGVRFLDIRCRHVTNTFLIHHDLFYEKMNFDDVLNAVTRFLKRNPTECVIMSVKKEYTSSGNTRSYESTFDSYVAKDPGVWYSGPAIPTLGQVRSKIVLFRRFHAASVPRGIDASVWPDNAAFSTDGGRLRVQDCYVVTNSDTKWHYVLAAFNEARDDEPDALYVNFLSGYQPGLAGIPRIPVVADDMNARLAGYLTTHPSGRCGIVIMDFADAAQCALVFNTNTDATKKKSTEHQH